MNRSVSSGSDIRKALPKFGDSAFLSGTTASLHSLNPNSRRHGEDPGLAVVFDAPSLKQLEPSSGARRPKNLVTVASRRYGSRQHCRSCVVYGGSVVTKAPPGAVAVVLAAGSGTRMGTDGNKAYLPLAGRRMLSWSLNSIAEVPELVRTVLVIRSVDRARALKTVDREVPDLAVEIIDGGSSRHQSEHMALEYLAPDIESGAVDVVLIHDAARPLAGPGMMRAAVSVARTFGGAVPGLETHDLVTVNAEGKLGELNRSGRYIRVQTPQAFHAAPLLHAHRAATAADFEGTDTSSSVERFADIEVRSFQGDPRNLKITYSQDLFLAERLLADAHYRLQ